METSSNIIKEYKTSLARLFALEGLSPFSNYVVADGPVRRIHYIEAGKGEPLILIHGGGGNNSHWYNLVKSLQNRFHLFLVDRPGCGLTGPFCYQDVDMIWHPVDFIKSFLDAMGLEKISFLSNSMGGYFTVRFALEFPERINRIVLAGAPAGMGNKTPFPMRLLGARRLNSVLNLIAPKPNRENTRKAIKQFITPNAEKLPQELIESCYLGSLLPGAEESWRTLLEQVLRLTGSGFRKSLDITNEVEKIQNPTLFIWGDKDAFAPPSVGEKAVSRMKNASLEIIKNGGHQPWWDEPRMCADLIINFLSKDQYDASAGHFTENQSGLNI